MWRSETKMKINDKREVGVICRIVRKVALPVPQ